MGTDDQALSLSGNTLALEDGGTVNLAGYLDNTDDQTATEVDITDSANNFAGTTVEAALAELATGSTDDQALSLSGNTLALEDGGTVNLAGYLDNTDDQTATEVDITDSANNFAGTTVEAALAELAADSQNLATDNLTQDAEARTYDMNTQTLGFTNGSFGIGKNNPNSVLDVLSNQNQNAFNFYQNDGTTGERDVFSITDADNGGGGQDHSSVLKLENQAILMLLI